MEGSSKREEETGFAALFNEFVSKVQTEPKNSPEVEEINPDPEDDKQKEVEEKSKEEKSYVEGESSHSGNKTEVPLSEHNSDIKMESSEPEKEAGTVDKDKLQTSDKHSSSLESEETVLTTGSEENLITDANIERSKQLLRDASSQESSPQSVHQESSPIPSNSDSSYQTSPASSTFSSTVITPASSPLTTLQSRSTILSAASTKLSSSSARRVPSKVEKPVLRDRAGRKRYNSLESEYVVNIDVKRERSKSGTVSQSSRRRQSRAEREGPRYRNQRGKPTPKPEERKRPQEKVMRPGLEFVVGFKLEAMDFCQNKWYAAKIVQVDEEDQQVLIHFEKWNSRYDEWIDCESERLRPLVRQSTRKETLPQQHPTGEYKYGEEVLARWSDCRYYPAKVLNINKNGTYRMLFYDGIEKNVLATNIRVMPDELKAQNFFSNFTLPPAPPLRGKKRWSAKEENFPAPTEQLETTPEPTSPTTTTTTTTKRRLSSGPASPLSPLPVPSKKIKVDEKVKSPKEVKAPKTKVAAPAVSTDPIPESQASSDAGVPILVDPKPVLKPVLSSAKMEELISRNIKEPLLNDKDLGLLRDRRKKILAPKELVIDLDHNKYKCDVKGCDKSFRKSTLLEYHKKYYHATKTSTSSAASRVLHRTRKRRTGSRSNSRSRRRSKGIRRKRLSAPADLVSSYPTRRADRSVVKKAVVSPGAVPEEESPTSPLADRRSSRTRHHSAPIQTQVPETRTKPRPVEKAASEPKVEGAAASVESQGATEEVVKSAEAAPKKPEEVELKTVPKEAEKKSPSVEKVYETHHQYAKKPDEPLSTLKHAVDTSKELEGKTDKEEVPLVKEMKSILKDVSMLQEEIRKEEERHRHRRKHKKNKDRKRRKKKKKDKDKKRRTKVKGKTGEDGSDEDTDSDEEDEERREERKLPLNDDTPSRVLFKQPSQVTEVRRQPTATFKSLVGVDDDVIKCICKNTREEGFMIQCEICNCWQHSTCVGLSDKSVPKTYACFFCHVSRGGMPPFYDSEAYEWFESGSLPHFPNFGKERSHQEEKWARSCRLTTNSLIADLLMLAEVLQSLQHKISILQNPDHPEAKLWAKDWILRSRKEAAASITDCGMSDDLASTLKEMFSLGKLLQQGQGSHLGEGSERSDLLSGGIGPNTGERDAVSSSIDDQLERDTNTGVPMDLMVTDGTVEDLSGGDGLSGSMKGMEETEAAIHSESSTFVSADLAGTSFASVKGNQSTDVGGKGLQLSSKDDRTQERSIPKIPPAVTQSESRSVSTSQESSGVTSKVGNMVTSSSNLDGATFTQTKQTKESPGDTLEAAVGEKSSGSDVQEMDEKSESPGTRVEPQTEAAGNVGTVSGSIYENTHSSESTDISHHSITASSSSTSSDVPSGIQDIPTVSSVSSSTSVLKKELASTGQNSVASTSKQEMGVVSGSDQSVSKEEVSGADHSAVAYRSESSTVECSDGQNTESSKPVQTSQPVKGQTAPNTTSTEILISDKSSVTTDSSKVIGDGRLVKGDDSVELVSGSDDSVGMDSTQAVSLEESASDSKKMVFNVEDVIRRQMSKDKPGPSKPTENEIEGDEMSSTAAPTHEDTERQGVEAMDVDNTSFQDKDAESSVEPPTEVVSENVVHEEDLEDASVEVSQAYLLRHINTLHDQLSERMNLIETEVEKLEKMFFSSASEWQAITQDQTVMKKKMRVLLGDLHKINTIVSL